MKNKIDTEKYEAALRKAKDKVWEEIQELETPTDFGDDIGDPDDEEADEDEELENTGGAAATLRGRLEDIEHAINKIAIGEYGVCENCGKPIEAEVLKVVPESRLCKEDKKAALEE